MRKLCRCESKEVEHVPRESSVFVHGEALRCRRNEELREDERAHDTRDCEGRTIRMNVKVDSIIYPYRFL